MPARVAMRTAELATAVLSGFGCGTHVITYFLPRRSLVPNHSRRVRAWANSWQGCVMVSMLMTGTLAYLAKPWITRSWRSTDQSSNMGNARTAMASQYVESTRAASLMCSSASPSMITCRRQRPCPRRSCRVPAQWLLRELPRPEFKGCSGAQGWVEEEQRDRLAFQQRLQRGVFQLAGVLQHLIELIPGPILGFEEVHVHTTTPSCMASRAPTKDLAAAAEGVAMKMVSSPAMQPTMPSGGVASSLLASSEACPGAVRNTTMVPAMVRLKRWRCSAVSKGAPNTGAEGVKPPGRL